MCGDPEKLINNVCGYRSICCWFCTIYILGLSFLFSFLIFWFIFWPQEPRFIVANASLTQFSFNNTNNTTLNYNLAVNITIRNPNKRVGISYRRIQVIANYRNKRFALVTLTSTPFYQGHKNTTELHNVYIQGSQLVKFGKREISQFNKETAAGIYSIELKLALQIKAKFGKITSTNHKPYRKIDCDLQVPLSLNETHVNGFRATECGDVYFFYDPDADND